MPKLTRGEFFRATTAGMAGSLVGFGLPSGYAAEQAGEGPDRLEADLVVVNARVYTSNPAQPRPRRSPSEREVHRRRHVRRRGEPEDGTHRGDRRRRRARSSPGFIDAHSHPAWGGISELRRRQLRSSAASPRSRTPSGRRAAATPPGGWVIGFKYDDTKTRDSRRLTRRGPRRGVARPPRAGHAPRRAPAAGTTAGPSRWPA